MLFISKIAIISAYNMVKETITHADTLRDIVNSFTLNR